MRDIIGNKLEAGQYIYWTKHQMVYKIIEVIESGLSVVGPQGKQLQPPRIKLEVEVPMLMTDPNAVEATVGEFIRVVDPRAEDLMNKVMAGKTQ